MELQCPEFLNTRALCVNVYMYLNQGELIFPAERYRAFEPQGVSVVAPLARAKIHNIWCSKYEVVHSKKECVESILHYRLICHLHSGTYIVNILYQNVSGKSIENQELIRRVFCCGENRK